MQHDFQRYSDMYFFFNSTCDMGINKRQRYGTLAFLKIDLRHWGPLIKGPSITSGTGLSPGGTVAH